MFLEDRGRGRGEDIRDGALYACNLLSSGCSEKPNRGDCDVSKPGVFFYVPDSLSIRR